MTSMYDTESVWISPTECVKYKGIYVTQSEHVFLTTTKKNIVTIYYFNNRNEY